MQKIIHLVCLLSLALVAVAQAPTRGISCQITSNKQLYKVGEEPQIAIHLVNQTDSIIQIVKVLDGSESQMRFPYVYYEVYKLTGSTSKKVPRPLAIRCGNIDGISPGDFVALKAGQSFSPLANQSLVYTSDVSLAGWIRKKGRYKVLLHYSTNQADFKQWMGDIALHWFDGATGYVLPSKRETYETLTALFTKVPKADVVSNELILSFQ